MSNDSGRILPDAPGWWWAEDPTLNGGRPAAYEVFMTQYGPWISGHGAIADLGLDWLAPVPSPAVSTALVEYAGAMAAYDTDELRDARRELTDDEWLASEAIERALSDATAILDAAIRAERDGAA